MGKDNLAGMLVLVHPWLEHDPAGQQGQIGVIQYADIEKDEMHVGFPKGKEGIYASDSLFTIKNKHDLFQEVMTSSAEIDLNDFKDLYKIALLQNRGTNKGLIDAMEIAKSNPSIWSESLVKVDELIRQSQSHSYSR